MNSLLGQLRKSSHAHSEIEEEVPFHLEMQAQEDRTKVQVCQ